MVEKQQIYNSTITRDCSDQNDLSRQSAIINSLLNLFLHTENKNEFLDKSLEILLTWIGINCGGVRVTDNQGNIPYASSKGFDDQFIQSEKWLSVKRDNCACIRVILGDIETQDKSQMTRAGSFCCNDTVDFVDKLNDTEKTRFRGVCVQRGFNSVAVIPIQYGSKILGAIHLADVQKDSFDQKAIEFIEKSVAPIIGEGVYRFSVEEQLQYNLKTQTALTTILRTSLEDLSLEEVLNLALDVVQTSGLFPSQVRSCIYLAESKTDEFVLRAQQGKESQPLRKCTHLLFNDGIYGQAVATKAVQFNDQHNLDCEELTSSGTNSCYCVPIVSGKAALGLLTVYLEPKHRREQNEENFLMAIASALAIVIWRKQSDEKLRSLSHRLVGVQEEERRAIALELHDQIGQMLTGLKLMITQASRSSAEDRQNILGEAQQTLSELIVKVREMSLNLRPSMVDDLGLLPTFLWQFQQYQTKAGIKVDFKHSGLDRQFPKDVSIAAYRIVQEALTNIMRHAKVKEVSVNTWADEENLHVMIEDRGAGFIPEAVVSGTSVGLQGMRERAILLGGSFIVESTPGKGTRITAVLPIHD